MTSSPVTTAPKNGRMPRRSTAPVTHRAGADEAIAAGIPATALRAIAEHRQPHFDTSDEQVFYTFCVEMLENHFVSDATFAAALDEFGNQGVVDIIGCLGNFSMLAMCLNAFQVDLDPKRTPPYPDIRGFERIAPRVPMTAAI